MAVDSGLPPEPGEQQPDRLLYLVEVASGRVHVVAPSERGYWMGSAATEDGSPQVRTTRTVCGFVGRDQLPGRFGGDLPIIVFEDGWLCPDCVRTVGPRAFEHPRRGNTGGSWSFV